MGKLRAALFFSAVIVFAQPPVLAADAAKPAQFTFTPVQTQVIVGIAVNWQVTATDANGNPVVAYNGTTAAVKTTDPKALPQTQTISFTNGTATLAMAFMTPGVMSVTVTDNGVSKATGSLNVTVVTASAAAISGCGSCYASLGAGAEITGTSFGDYNDTANVLQSTHLANDIPQIAVGVAYKLPIRGPLHKPLHCSPNDFFNASSEAKAAYCFPFKAFVSLKFTPDASQTFNGFTYGFSNALHKDLDVLFGVSYSAFNEASPGFRQTAISTVQAQQALGNPYYSQWSVTALEKNAPTAFDGFPTQLINSNGAPGPQIYIGNPLVVHYHTGFLIGVSVPVSFKSALGGGS